MAFVNTTGVTAVALLPRLLAGMGDQPVTALASHLGLYGPLPDLRGWAPEQLVEVVEQAGLRGRGGASFPVATKMRAVVARRRPRIVVANGAEGEPASKKDRALLRELPHLVLDGAAIAARAIGAREAIIALSENDDRGARRPLARRAAIRAVRRSRVLHLRPIERTGQRGVRGTGETDVRLAAIRARRQAPPDARAERRDARAPGLIARHGASWFRQLGTAHDPGSALVTLSGAVARPGVYEIEHGVPLTDLLETAGASDDLTAVLLGGYFGSWLPATQVPGLRLAPQALADYGASLGCGVIIALGGDTCPVAETARIADYFAAQTAGQCGPCVSGLAAIADTIRTLATGTAPGTAWRDLERWTTEIPRRGACQYPDGASRFIASALNVFADEFHRHARHGRCERCSARPVLPAPGARVTA